MMREMRIYPDSITLARSAAERFLNLTIESVNARGKFSVALSGGSTPRILYKTLSRSPFLERVPWEKVYVFWSDERCVPSNHLESNYRMARETLLDHVPLPERNIHRIHGEMEPEQAADEYEHMMQAFFSTHSDKKKSVSKKPMASFDLIILGMGDDGHTASLFPRTAVIHEQTRLVVAHYVDKLQAWRITLTPVAINTAANVIFIISGESKAERIRQVLAGPYQPDDLPVQLIRPEGGSLLWMLDSAAATLLTKV